MRMNLRVAAFGFALASMLAAQSSETGPALGVARVSLVNGDVTTQRGDTGDWVAAPVNTPLVEGDLLATGQGSRAELQLDYSNLVRLDANTELQATELAQKRFRVRLTRGRVTYSELRGGAADADVETEHVAVRPLQRGRYEVQVRPGETVVIVRNGKAEVASREGTETLKKGRMMVIRDGPDGPEFRTDKAGPRDDWDRWNKDRDDLLAKSDSYRYTSNSITGAEDLDTYGSWRYVTGYGYTWYPRVTNGWAPYRNGNWRWIDYYGWTWVGYEPWAWAPYHYGRWFHRAGYGWGWYPGPRHGHHYWRPALVGFFGYNSYSGFSFGLGFGFGNVGWVPLAPGERYYPWYGRGHYGGYGRGRGGINNSTIIVDNSINIYNNHRNARAHNGVTVVDAEGFSRGLVNNPRSLRSTELRRATAIRGQIPVVPARSSQGRVVRASNGRNSVAGRSFTTRGGSRPRIARVPFADQQQRLSSSVRSFSESRQNGTARSGGVRSASAPSQTRTARGGSSVSTPARGVRQSAAGSTRGSVRSATPGATQGARSAGRSVTSSSSSPVTVRGASPSRSRTATRSTGADGGFRPFGGSRAGSRVGRSTTTTRPSSGVSSSNRSGGFTPRSRSRVSSAAPSRSRSGSTARTTRTPSARPSSGASSSSRSGGFTPRSRSRVGSAAPSRSRGGSSATTSSTRSGRSGQTRGSVRSSSQRGGFTPRSSSRATTAPRAGAPSRSRPSGGFSATRGSRSQPSRSTGGVRSPGISRSAPSRPAPRATAPSRSRGGYSRGSSIGRSSAPRAAPSRSSGGARSSGGSRGGGGARSSAPSRSSGGRRR